MPPVVGLSRELNPEYWKLLEDSEQLINRWQRLNVKLTTFRVPRFPFFGSKTELKEIQKPFSQLQADTNRWLSRAGGFFVKNPPRFESDQDQALTILWTQMQLNLQISTMQERKFITHYSVKSLGGKIDHRQDFAIAITSCLLAIAGLIVALVFG